MHSARFSQGPNELSIVDLLITMGSCPADVKASDVEDFLVLFSCPCNIIILYAIDVDVPNARAMS